MELKVIVPDIKATFGKLVYAGRGKDKYVYNPITNARTDIVEARVYHLASEVQGGQIEIIVPGIVGELEFDFMEEVEIINPKITSTSRAKGTSSSGRTFSEVVWKCEADTICKKNSESETLLENTQGISVTSLSSSTSKSGAPLKNTGKEVISKGEM